MEWCNCPHSLQNVENICCGYLTCVNCGKRISNEDMIAILFLEIKTLKKSVLELEIDMTERNLLIAEKESAQLTEYKKIEKNLNKQIERFERMDL